MLSELLKFLGLFSPFPDTDIHLQWKYVVMQYKQFSVPWLQMLVECHQLKTFHLNEEKMIA